MIINLEEIYAEPLTGIHFSVEWGETRIGFTEVKDLETTVETIEY